MSERSFISFPLHQVSQRRQPFGGSNLAGGINVLMWRRTFWTKKLGSKFGFLWCSCCLCLWRCNLIQSSTSQLTIHFLMILASMAASAEINLVSCREDCMYSAIFVYVTKHLVGVLSWFPGQSESILPRHQSKRSKPSKPHHRPPSRHLMKLLTESERAHPS